MNNKMFNIKTQIVMKKLDNFVSTFAVTVCSIAMVLLFGACGKDAIEDDIQPAVTGSVEEDPHVLTSGTNMWKIDFRDYGIDEDYYIHLTINWDDGILYSDVNALDNWFIFQDGEEIHFTYSDGRMYYLAPDYWVGWAIDFPNDHTMNMNNLQADMGIHVQPMRNYVFTLM